MSEITIVRDAIGNMMVTQGREPKSRLEWSADGLQIYLRGRFPMGVYEKAANLAISECQSRHINTFSLRRTKENAK